MGSFRLVCRYRIQLIVLNVILLWYQVASSGAAGEESSIRIPLKEDRVLALLKSLIHQQNPAVLVQGAGSDSLGAVSTPKISVDDDKIHNPLISNQQIQRENGIDNLQGPSDEPLQLVVSPKALGEEVLHSLQERLGDGEKKVRLGMLGVLSNTSKPRERIKKRMRAFAGCMRECVPGLNVAMCHQMCD